MKKIKKITLSNGLRVLLIPKKESLATTALVLVAAGSKYETKEINGLSHFLEHLCFKGTETRPTALHITSELDALGASYNAFTGQEYTGYYAKVAPPSIEKALNIVSDLYVNPIFPPREIEKEKGVIIEEINMYEDLPMRRVQEIFMELMYGDQPAGWTIAGRKDVIRNLTREEIVKYRSEHYVGKATVVIVAGNFQEKKITGEIRKAFARVPDDKKSEKVKTVESQKKPMIKLQTKESDQTHIVLGVRAYDIKDKRRFALGVLTDILGGGMSSRLFQKVRDQLGAAYYVRAEVDAYTDHGLMAVSAGVDHKKLEVVVKAILEECNAMKNGLFTDDEIKKSKNHITGRTLIGLETSDEIALYYGTQEVLKEKLMSPEELVKKTNAVARREIIAVANDIFRNEKLNLAIIGPQKSAKPLEKILKFS